MRLPSRTIRAGKIRVRFTRRGVVGDEGFSRWPEAAVNAWRQRSTMLLDMMIPSCGDVVRLAEHATLRATSRPAPIAASSYRDRHPRLIIAHQDGRCSSIVSERRPTRTRSGIVFAHDESFKATTPRRVSEVMAIYFSIAGHGRRRHRGIECFETLFARII